MARKKAVPSAKPVVKPAPKVKKPVAKSTSIIDAMKRHGVLHIQYSHTGDAISDQSYMVGTDGNKAFMVILDKEFSSMISMSAKQLESIKFKIDEVLVEMGLHSINIGSASHNMMRTSKTPIK